MPVYPWAGGHTIYTGFDHPKFFGALGLFSTGLIRDFDTRNKSVLDSAKTFKCQSSTDLDRLRR
ncbi:MAG: hypothetical protein WBY44_16395 [Bryobacteraceae bacterium]